MPKSSVSFAFDHTSPEALAWAKDQAASLLSTIADREQVRSIIARAFSEHMTPQAAASLIRSVVGLTGPQTQAMLNLRSLLDPTSPTYAGDGALVYAGKTAIRIPEDGFDADMIDQRVEEYSDRLINQRARMIARTELIGASNAGTQEAWQQAVDEGLLTGGERREWMWVEGLDKVPCPTCSEMDGQRVELDAPFISPDGEEIMNPPAHPNCRCGQGLVTEAERQQEVADQTDEEASLETASAFLDDFPSAVTYEEWRDAIIAEQRGLIDVDAAERDLGGPGSGNFGHAGRPGEVGGSSTGGESGLTSKSSLTEGERETLSGYTFSPDVNDDLRQGKETDVSKTLDAVMAKSTLTKDQVLYRLVSEEQFAKLGVEFNDKGYLSTASTMEGLKEVQAALYQGDPNDSVFEHGVLRYENEDGDVDVQHVVELHVPAGTHAVDVNQNLGSKHEFSDAKEVLLDRDLTFTVSHRPDGTAILTKKDARALGGSGSGFFGHAGRPGEVGGSALDVKEDWTEGAKNSTKFTSKKADELLWYTENGAEGINNFLRHGAVATGLPDYTERQQSKVDLLDSVLARTQLREDVTLYRSVGRGVLDNLTVGRSFSDKSFLSTTKSLDAAKEFKRGNAIIKIEVPKGLNAVDVNNVIDNRHYDEHEVLLPRDLKFTVTAVGKISGRPSVTLRLSR